jgi:hypothetical protein
MMIDHRFWSLERAGGFFLVLGFVANFGGVLMFSLRHGTAGGPPPNQPYFVWERSFFLAAVVLTAIGFVLLEGYLRNTNGSVLARTGATAYLFGGILGVAAEALTLSTGFDEPHFLALINIYVVLAFLAQAAIGGALLQSGLLAAWIGWVTILWNLGCLVVLPVITPDDIYFPIFHHLMPLLIGSALLWRSRSHNSR